MEKLLKLLGEKYPLKALDAGEMASLKAKGMTFSVEAYEAEGLGHVSVMKAKGFFGLMKMDTLMINPKALDLPLYSYDRIFAAGNDTLIVELYDTVSAPFAEEALLKIKEEFAALPERDPGEHWYDGIKLASSLSKKGKKAQSGEFDRLALAHFEAFLAEGKATADESLKAQKTAAYVEGLLQNGGPSTDVFKKALGKEKTEKLFKTYLFGTE